MGAAGKYYHLPRNVLYTVLECHVAKRVHSVLRYHRGQTNSCRDAERPGDIRMPTGLKGSAEGTEGNIEGANQRIFLSQKLHNCCGRDDGWCRSPLLGIDSKEITLQRRRNGRELVRIKRILETTPHRVCVQELVSYSS